MDINEMRMILDKKALSDLPELVEIMDASHAHELAKIAEARALWLLRASIYIDARAYDGMYHQSAIKHMNKVMCSVRKALGFTYPKQDITF